MLNCSLISRIWIYDLVFETCVNDFTCGSSAGFDVDNIAPLISFAESFGASRLLDACVRFIELWKRKHETGQWLEIEASEALSCQPDFSAMNASSIMHPNEASPGMVIKHCENPDFVQPSFRLNEVQGWIKSGLRDFSISRAQVDWGIPVPTDNKQTLYVWFDALLGYISALSKDNEPPNNLSNSLSVFWNHYLISYGCWMETCGIDKMFHGLFLLVIFLAILTILCRTCVPWFLKLMISLSTQTNELYQLALVAFCLLIAWSSDRLGLSLELGSFAAGVMISATDLAQHTLEQVEPIRNLFVALFLSSIGMLIHVQFLWNHVDILVAAVILVIVIKTIVVAIVVKGFGYNNKTAILVGMSLAQIGEFAFVLLSRASNLKLVETKLYLLLLGTTALSLVTTPLLFKLVPAVVHIGEQLRWFSPEIPVELCVVRAIAVLGGILQILLFMCLGGITVSF